MFWSLKIKTKLPFPVAKLRWRDISYRITEGVKPIKRSSWLKAFNSVVGTCGISHVLSRVPRMKLFALNLVKQVYSGFDRVHCSGLKNP